MRGVDHRQVQEKDGSFALLMAAEKGHEAVVRVLLAAGADAKQVSSAECRGAESGGVLEESLLRTCHDVGARRLKGNLVLLMGFQL